MDNVIGLGAVRRNVKDVEFYIENEHVLKLIQKTPTLSNLFAPSQRKELKVGKNKVPVNHYIFSKLQNFESIFQNLKEIK